MATRFLKPFALTRWLTGTIRSLLKVGAALGAITIAAASTAGAAEPSAVDPFTIDLSYAQSLAGAGHQVHVVAGSIQAAVNLAVPGDVIFVPPGSYAENVQVRTDGLTIVGPRSAVLNGAGLAGVTGIDVRPGTGATGLSGFDLVGLSIQNYQRNGVRLSDVADYSLLSGEYIDNQEYGLYPVRSTNGLVEGNVVSGADDTGIYIGQSSGAIIRNNHAFDNTIGIEVENSVDITVTNNLLDNNSVGVFGVVLPGRTIPMTQFLTISDNNSLNNNRLNPVTDPTDVLSRLPYGIGMLFLATDQTSVFNNQITGNGSLGLGLLRLPPDIAALDLRIDPFPDFNTFFNNIVLGNGTGPDPKLALLGLPPVDILWDTSGSGNGWQDNQFSSSFPRVLPQPVPEPAAWLMMIVGFGLTGGLLRRIRASGWASFPVSA